MKNRRNYKKKLAKYEEAVKAMDMIERNKHAKSFLDEAFQ